MMDQLQQDDIIEKARILLEMETVSKYDSLFEVYFEIAQDFIFDYCKVSEVPSSLYSVLSKMIVFQYRQKGIENIQSEGKGSLSEAYITEYPPNIMNRLQPYCQVKFL